MIFADRVDAGKKLAARLNHLKNDSLVVLGLPRGGVPVAYQVARELDAPLDVIVVRKLGVPFQPELAMGSIGEGGVLIRNSEILRRTGVSEREFGAVEEKERIELDRRVQRFRANRPRIGLEGRTAVIIDDGIATGSTALAACQVARAQGAARVVLGVPVAPPDWKTHFDGYADELISLETPEPFWAIGQFYDNFNQTSDDEVLSCLERSHLERSAQSNTTMALVGDSPQATSDPDSFEISFDDEVELLVGPVHLGGHLTIPALARGVVIFAHGSGSSSHSPRNRYVAAVLNAAGLGTLLFDLLTLDEEHDRANVFDIDLLAERLVGATHWLHNQPQAGELSISYFGASTGAAAALMAAGARDVEIAAVVSRGGRPDLAGAHLADVRAPTLLIVGGDDKVVVELNRQAQTQLRCENRLAVIPGATHLFEEPGTLQAAAEAARDWFISHPAMRRQPPLPRVLYS